jgi:chromosomal replication initiator protein
MFRDPGRVGEAEQLVARVLAASAPPGPAVHFTRTSFEASACNQFALHAADAVAREPGRRYNPLFVQGPSGSGKSHLVHAVGNEVLARSGGAARVACVDAEAFSEELIAALREGSVERWRARYRSADLFILDDVHAIAGKERTQEELFHLFNALHAAGRQIVLASDRAPKALQQVEERLRSRFEGGLVVELRAPDAALCEQLCRRGFRAAGIEPAPELLAYLAARRTPAAVPALDAFFLDREKTLWEWPDVGGRAIEELR